MQVRFKKLSEYAQLPAYQSAEAAGFDLRALKKGFIPPHQVVMVETGLAIAIDAGFEGQVRARSGLASKGIMVANAPGTVDSDYRGEVKVLLFNSTNVGFPYEAGDRIAQMVISPVVQADIVEVTELNETVRGTGGFGSTGN